MISLTSTSGIYELWGEWLWRITEIQENSRMPLLVRMTAKGFVSQDYFILREMSHWNNYQRIKARSALSVNDWQHVEDDLEEEEACLQVYKLFPHSVKKKKIPNGSTI